MQRRTFLRFTSLAGLGSAFGGSLVGCDSSGVAGPAGDPAVVEPTSASGSVRLAFGRDGAGFALHPGAGVVRTLDAAGSEAKALAMGDHASPIAATSALDGTIAIVDASRARIELYSRDGRTIGAIADDELRAPRDVAFTDDGILVVVDASGHRIVGYTLDSSVVFSFGGNGTGGASLNGPSSVAIGADGLLHVADRGNARIATFTTGGALVAEFGRYGRGDGEFLSPRAIACGVDGRLHVADPIRGDVQSFENGVLVARAVQDGVPVDLAIRPDGSLYVALA